MKQKGVTNVTSILIAAVVAIAILQGLFTFYSNLYVQYDVGVVNNTFSSAMLNFSDKIGEDVNASIARANAPKSPIEQFFTILDNGWSMMLMVFDLPNTLIEIFSTAVSGDGGVGDVVPVPLWVSTLINIVVWIIIFAALIKIFFRREV